MLGSQQAQGPAALSGSAQVRAGSRAHLLAFLRDRISVKCHVSCQARYSFSASSMLAH